MPDPIEELENFSIPGPAMNPMPAAEVRRRGNRIRRRNNALAAVGGVAAVALIATPFALFAGGQSSPDSVDPAPQPTTWVQEVPDGFDITTGIGDGQTEVTTSDDPLLIQNVCGVGWHVVPEPADQLTASMANPDSEGGHTRYLAVFDDFAQASAAMAQFDEAPSSCDGVYDDEGTTYEMLPADVAGSSAEDSSAWVQAMHDEVGMTGEGYVTVAQQVGNALLIDTAISGGVGDETVRDLAVSNLVDRSQDVVGSMCEFSVAGCGDNGEAVDPGNDQGPAQEVPAGFPLSDQMPDGTKERDGYEQQHVDVCDNQSWTADDTIDARQAAYTGETEGGWDRTLGVYATEDEATLAFMSAKTGVQACVLDSEGGKRWVTTLPSSLGDSSVVYVNHMGSGDGAFVVQLVQVGNAILQDTTYVSDGDPQAIQETADQLADSSTGVVDAMCAFTEDGC